MCWPAEDNELQDSFTMQPSVIRLKEQKAIEASEWMWLCTFSPLGPGGPRRPCHPPWPCDKKKSLWPWAAGFPPDSPPRGTTSLTERHTESRGRQTSVSWKRTPLSPINASSHVAVGDAGWRSVRQGVVICVMCLNQNASYTDFIFSLLSKRKMLKN